MVGHILSMQHNDQHEGHAFKDNKGVSKCTFTDTRCGALVIVLLAGHITHLLAGMHDNKCKSLQMALL